MHEGLLRLASELGISRLKLSGEDLEVEFFRASSVPADPDTLPEDDEPRVRDPKLPIGAAYLSSDDQRTLLDPYHDMNT